MATITHDTLDWYGRDADAASVQDVIGSRCDPYTNRLLKQTDYHYCGHSHLIRALAGKLGQPMVEVEHPYDVMNVFKCTDFTLATSQYFMEASPVSNRSQHARRTRVGCRSCLNTHGCSARPATTGARQMHCERSHRTRIFAREQIRPVRPADYIEFFAEIDLLAALSACPGGNCGTSHSDDATPCYPLLVEIYAVDIALLEGWHSPQVSGYSRGHSR